PAGCGTLLSRVPESTRYEFRQSGYDGTSMIHYQLRCSQAHEFDGWFANSAGFDRQAKRGLVECPVCGDVKVSRALMAPSVSTRGALSAPAEAEAPSPPPAATPPVPAPLPAPMAGGRMPAHLRAML